MPLPTGPLDAMNSRMAQLEAGEIGLPLPPNTTPSTGVFANPGTTVAPTPGPPIVPTPDLGGIAEQRNVSSTLGIPAQKGTILSNRSSTMPQYAKCTFFFEQNIEGWSETLIYKTPALSPNAVLPFAKTYASKRSQMMGNQASINYVRISMVDLPRVYPASPRQSQIYAFSPPYAVTGLGDSDFQDNAILCNMQNGAGAPAKFLYMRGIPDKFVVLGGLEANDPAVFFPGWNAWVAELIANWGWIGLNTRNSSSPVSFQQVGGQISLTLKNAIWPAGAATTPTPTYLPLRLSRFIIPGNVNNVYPFQITGLTSATSRNRIAMLPWDGQTGVINYNVNQFVAITGVVPQRIASRKAGRIFDVPAGRRRNRKTA